MVKPKLISPELQQIVATLTQETLADVTAFRHECHQYPELTWQEQATASRVAKELRAIPGIAVTDGWARFGVCGVIEGQHKGPTIALRADMDALPLDEKTNVEYRSQHPGVMHACGHDGHMANLLGAAKVLVQLREHLHGRVKLIFQPAEEGGGGARELCEAGILRNPDVDVIFGLHGWPEAPCGQIWLKEGPLLASNTEIAVTVRGKGCHAAMPHLGTDQVLIAARMIDQLQAVAARMVAPTEPIALSITRFQGGQATNIIPDEVRFSGTLRTVNPDTRDLCAQKINSLLNGIAQAHGVHVDVELRSVYPETINHPEPTQWVKTVAEQLWSADKVKMLPAPTMGAEDFSFYLQQVPGAFFFLGMNEGAPGEHPPLHHPQYDFSDRALPTGIQLFCHLALTYGMSYSGKSKA